MAMATALALPSNAESVTVTIHNNFTNHKLVMLCHSNLGEHAKRDFVAKNGGEYSFEANSTKEENLLCMIEAKTDMVCAKVYTGTYLLWEAKKATWVGTDCKWIVDVKLVCGPTTIDGRLGTSSSGRQ